MLIYSSVSNKGKNNSKKSFKNVWRLKNMYYLCTRNQEIQRMTWKHKGSLKRWWKKSSSKIWWFEKFVLPLQPLSPLKLARRCKRFLEKFLKKKSSKNLVVWKICLTFAPLSHLKKLRFESELKMVLWFTGFIYWEKSVVFICQFPFRKNWNSQDSNNTL